MEVMVEAGRDRPTGIAIIGCGMISDFQAQAIRDVDGAEVVGFQSRSVESARARVEQYGGVTFESFDEVLRDSAVDAVSICTPSGAHLEPARDAAVAGKHVMVEKPIEITLDRCDELVRSCAEAGIILGAIFPRRFEESSLTLKRAVDAGRFGRIVLADVAIKWWRSQDYYDTGGWKGTWDLDGGGALMNQGIHGIDLLQWLVGGVESVTGVTDTLAHTGIEVEDVATAAVRFKNGALGTIVGTTGAWPGTKIRIEICGTEGHVVLQDEVIHEWNFQHPHADDDRIRQELGPREGLSGGGATDPKAISYEGHRRQFVDFVTAIRTGGSPRIDGAEARAAVAIITSIYKSAKEGRAIRIE